MKETKELVVGLLKVATVLAESFKDGVQTQDIGVIAAKIQSDESLKAALLAAYNDVELAKEEIKDLDLAKSIELVGAALPEVLALIKAVSKK